MRINGRFTLSNLNAGTALAISFWLRSAGMLLVVNHVYVLFALIKGGCEAVFLCGREQVCFEAVA